MRSVRIALTVGLAIAAVAVAGVLSESPLAVLATNGVSAREGLAAGWKDGGVCQAGERLPRATTAVRLSIGAIFGPRVRIAASAGARRLTFGEQGAGWAGRSVTIPVRPISRTSFPVKLCFATGASNEGVSIDGVQTPEASAALGRRGQSLAGRISVEYLGKGRSSWPALASSVASHMALGRAWSGIWVVYLVAISMLAVVALAAWLAARELNCTAAPRRPARAHLGRALCRLPSAAWICALIAFLSAMSWSFITPPFQAPDEPSHFAYVKQLADTGTLPTSSTGPFSNEEQVALAALNSEEIRLEPGIRALFTQTQQRELGDALELLNRSSQSAGSPGAGVATSEPPLYYALESIPYRLGSSGTLLDRLQLMRLLSALMAAGTALFTFLFVRETLPRARWAWSAGALPVALAPLFGFMSGAVNPDAMLFAVCAALFYCLARAFRRGLTTRAAIVTGLVIAIGLLTKLSFIGLAPGAILALCLLAVRAARSEGLRALRPHATAAAIGCAPIVVFVARNTVSNHSALGIFTATLDSTHGSLIHAASYIWQLYLPPLPGMAHDFPGLLSTRQIWFDGYVGRLGWLETTFPAWVYTFALLPSALIAALCARALIASRAALRARIGELTAYAFMALGLLVLVGASSYGEFPQKTASYGQARYLLPLLPLAGVTLALAARGAGRRWGPPLGALVVVLFLAHDVFSQLQAIARFYG